VDRRYIDNNSILEKMSEKAEEELNELAVKTLEIPYREWMMKEKTKIRYNYAEDAKRTWNRIKQASGQATKIKPEIFKDHYEKNWANAPQEVNIEENSKFIIQRKLVFKEDEMVKSLLDKEKRMKAIATKGNLSAPGIDKLTYPNLKYEKEEVADVMIKIMTMMLKVQKCHEVWKEDKPGNWRPITLTSILYRIIFGRIAEYFQQIHKRKTFDGEWIDVRSRRGLSKISMVAANIVRRLII
jgi:hypothetical protein